MSKYNRYAKDLRSAFVGARDRYATAYEKVQAAEAALVKAKADNTHFLDVKMAKIGKAEAELRLAQSNFNTETDEAWREFNRAKQRLTDELAAAVKADRKLNPDTIDQNALELLKSGAMSADDYTDFINKYADNNAMLALIGKAAADVGNNETRDYDERKPFMYAARLAKETADGTTMTDWDNLCAMCDRLSGQSHGRGEPLYATRMNNAFEEMADPMIEGF